MRLLAPWGRGFLRSLGRRRRPRRLADLIVRRGPLVPRAFLGRGRLRRRGRWVILHRLPLLTVPPPPAVLGQETDPIVSV